MHRLVFMCGNILLRSPLSVVVGSANRVKISAVRRSLAALEVEAEVTGASKFIDSQHHTSTPRVPRSTVCDSVLDIFRHFCGLWCA